MSNGHTRQVPPIDSRPDIVLRVHSSAGHFGYRRTLHLLLAVYAWSGMPRMVKQLVGACELCHRARASFTGQTVELQPHPVVGMFHTWGVDLSGPYTVKEMVLASSPRGFESRRVHGVFPATCLTVIRRRSSMGLFTNCWFVY